jgi:RND family efflux transporter MFP subunit
MQSTRALSTEQTLSHHPLSHTPERRPSPSLSLPGLEANSRPATLTAWPTRRWVPSGLALGAVCLLAACAGGCQQTAEAQASLPAVDSSPRISVRVTAPATTVTMGAAKVTGTVRSRHEATLSAKMTAQILSLNVDVGARVKAGQQLVVLDSRLTAAQLENAKAATRLAEANLTNSTRELQRAEALASSDAVAGATVDRARTSQEVAEAQLAQARAGVRSVEQSLRDSVMSAPFAGVVTARMKNQGDTVSGMPPTPILTVTDLDHLETRLMVPEGLVGFLHTGDALSATTNPDGLPLKAKVRVIGSTIDSATRSVEVLADVLEPLDQSLRSGVLVTAELTAGGSLPGPFIPASTVHSDGPNKYVMVVDHEKVVRREIVVSAVNPSTVWVKSGLSPSDPVVMGSVDQLKPGTPVVVMAE